MGLEVAGVYQVPAQTKRIALLVLGMHRSGTSALTRCLNLLGAGLPKTVFGAAADNEKGHWEPQKLLDLNNEFLSAVGSRWDDWRPLDLSDAATIRGFQDRISTTISEEYGDAPIIVIKDPRICRFSPIYKRALAESGIESRFVIPLRNPLAVIQSLETRDAMAPSFSSLLWFRHVIDAEAATRGSARAFLSYEKLMEDWQGTISKMSHQMGVDWPIDMDDVADQVNEFLSPALQHHMPASAELDERKDIPDQIKTAFGALQDLENGNDAALETLSRLKAEFDREISLAGDAAFDELAAREHKFSARIREQEERAGRQDALIRNLHNEVKNLRDETAALTTANANLTEQTKTWEDTRARLGHQIESLGSELSRYRRSGLWRIWRLLERR